MSSDPFDRFRGLPAIEARLRPHVRKPWAKALMGVLPVVLCCALPVLLWLMFSRGFFAPFIGSRVRITGEEFFRMWCAMAGYVLSGFLCIGFFATHLRSNERLSDAQRTRWAYGLAYGGPLAMPLYFWMHVRNEKAEKETNSPKPAA